MNSIEKELIERIKNVNASLKNRYSLVLDKDFNLRDFIINSIGSIRSIERLTSSELEALSLKGGVLGVDGSVNRLGGAFPHYIEIYRALAFSTSYKTEPLFISQVYSPIDSIKESSVLEIEEDKKDERDIKLANIELEAAILGVEKFKPRVLMLDGGFIRYKIYAKNKWDSLCDLCIANGVLMLGVIKDIKTSTIGDELLARGIIKEMRVFDRELLFGICEYRELIEIRETVSKKSEEGLISAFIRSSLAPNVIGLDILDDQKRELEFGARLVLSLTPKSSRGVPLWLDIIDKEVKVSDDMIRALMERYLDRDIYERFFVSERDKRS